jgi:hypothetical protein
MDRAYSARCPVAAGVYCCSSEMGKKPRPLPASTRVDQRVTASRESVIVYFISPSKSERMVASYQERAS